MEDLEAQNLERAFEIRELENENAMLIQRVGDDDPELTKVTRERDEAQKKLENAQKFIKDLLGGERVRRPKFPNYSGK